MIEILIVVVILGILATIVIPQFSNASQQARESTLKDDLRFLRLQVQVFKAQHRDVPPGYPGGDRSASPSDNDFAQQMTHYSSEDAATNPTASSSFKFGPYLSRVPMNPVNGQSGIYAVANDVNLPTAGDLPLMNGSVPYGWIYKAQTQEFMANLAENDTHGTAFASY